MGILRGKKVSFWATKEVPKEIKVRFRTSDGRRVSFWATKNVPINVKVSFWASKQGRKVKRRKW